MYTTRNLSIGPIGDADAVEWLKAECESGPESTGYPNHTTLIRRIVGFRALKRPNMSVKLRSIWVVTVALSTPITREIVPGGSCKTEERSTLIPLLSEQMDTFPMTQQARDGLSSPVTQ